ncbi:MAG: replicative DNA helicase [Patescibacteria group bacterium]|nr:replicative DNA helicase [Patescibacteria group bacterium]
MPSSDNTLSNRPFAKKQLRMPPQDLNAERAMLGSILVKPDGIYESMDTISADDFYAEKHRRIYQAMLNLREQNEPIDIVSLTSKLKEHEQLESIGGASYLASLVNLVSSATNLEHYCALIKKKALLRSLIQSGDKIGAMGYNETDDIDNIFDQAQQVIFDIGHFSKKSFLRLKDSLAEAWERFDKLHKSGEGLRGVPTGFSGIDDKLSGLQKSDLIILAARPSVGKTSLALDIARRAACDHKKSIGIFSLEMSSQQLVDRLLAAESRVDSWQLRTGRLKQDEDFTRLRDALDKLSNAPIYIDDNPGSNITQIRSSARKMKAENDLDLIIVDYLQLMVPRKDTDSMVQQVTEISRSLKGLARELEVPVLALSQLSRAVEQRGGKPRLSDLRDSGSIEQDADVVLFIHREDKNNEESERKNIAEIIIAKHRNGPTGQVDLFFDEKRVSFTTVDKQDFGGF